MLSSMLQPIPEKSQERGSLVLAERSMREAAANAIRLDNASTETQLDMKEVEFFASLKKKAEDAAQSAL